VGREQTVWRQRHQNHRPNYAAKPHKDYGMVFSLRMHGCVQSSLRHTILIRFRTFFRLIQFLSVWFKLTVTVTKMTIDGNKSNPLTVHRVPKNCAKLFLPELRQICTNFDIFWQKDGKTVLIFSNGHIANVMMLKVVTIL